MKQTNASNINDVRRELVQVFNDLRSGKIEAKEAVEINNTAGKIISACKVELAYHALRGQQPDIAFLNGAPLGKQLPPPQA